MTAKPMTTTKGGCPYLHQLQTDWLSMDPQGYYCRGYLGRITMLDAANDLGGCALRHYSACSEYQAIEASGTESRRAPAKAAVHRPQ